MGRVDPDQLPVPLIQADFFGPDQDRKQFLISVAFQQSRLAEGIQQAEGQDGSKEIAELAANDGVVIMDPSLIEIAGGFIEPHDDLDIPPLAVSLISDFRRDIQITLQHDGPEGPLLLLQNVQVIGPVLPCPAEPVLFFCGSFAAVPEGVEPFIKALALLFPVGDAFIAGQDSGKVKHVMPFNELGVSFDRIEVMQIRVLHELLVSG